MTHTQHDTQFAQLVQRIAPQGRLLRWWELKGGISADVTAFEVEKADGEVRKMIVRRRRLNQNETLEWRRERVAKEFRILQIMQAIGVVVPTPYYLDQSCDMLPTSYLLLEYIEGQPNFALTNGIDMAFQLARQLAKIHRIDGSTLDLSFLPQPRETFSQRFGEQMSHVEPSSEEWRIAERLQAVWPTVIEPVEIQGANQPTLLHGDFWPGNVLWRDGQLMAVIDWEDAKLGNPLEDVAITRFDMLFIYGLDAMNEFTRTYQSMSTIDMSNLPYWDLYAALRAAPGFVAWAKGCVEFGRADITEQHIREAHGSFVRLAFEKI